MTFAKTPEEAFVSISVVAGFREASIGAFQMVTTPIAGKISPVHGKNSRSIDRGRTVHRLPPRKS